jgi:hypothetical protein
MISYSNIEILLLRIYTLFVPKCKQKLIKKSEYIWSKSLTKYINLYLKIKMHKFQDINSIFASLWNFMTAFKDALNNDDVLNNYFYLFIKPNF